MNRLAAIALLLSLATPASADRRKNSLPGDVAVRHRNLVSDGTLNDGPRTCTRVVLDQVAFDQLRVVGIVEQHKDRIVLVEDRSNRGYVVRAGECVGRERVAHKTLVARALLATR